MGDVPEHAFAFIDLSGFSLLTEAHGDADAADLAERLVAVTRESLRGQTELVKSVGDEVMLAGEDSTDVLATVLAVAARSAAEPEFLAVRAGLHLGTAVRRGGDYFGAGVNVAARVAALAGSGQALMTGAVATYARVEGHLVAPLGSRRLRNIGERVEVFVLQLSNGGRAVDPVCRMLVDPRHAAGHLRHADRDWWFCSLECAGRFAADPSRFTPGQ